MKTWGYFTICFLSFFYLESCSNEANDLLYTKNESKIFYNIEFIGEKTYIIDAIGKDLEISIRSNVDYSLLISQEWVNGTIIRDKETSNVNSFKTTNNYDSLIIKIGKNDNNNERYADIIITNYEHQISDTLKIKQKRKEEFYTDGELKCYQKANDNKVNLLILGDGFTFDDLKKGGYYEKSMNKAMESFFSIEPYKSYRDYFNVYMMVVESEEEGVGEKNLFGGGFINNKFRTAYGDGTEIVCDDELIFEYARKVKELPEDKPITVLVVLNSDKYAGTAYLYPDGNSIALCPMSTAEPPNDFEGIIHHEAGGHAFGFLLDEYVYNQNKMPENRKKEIQEWQKKGYQMNLDFTNDLDKILWKDFIGIDKYAPVGAYEGGYEYQYGVWRSEENSCMNNNIPYYNVQSRWSIVNRIMQLSDIKFTVQDFIENDHPIYPIGSRALNTWEKFVPLGHPIWVKK